MKTRRIPVASVDKKKRGVCRLCGAYGVLTKTHVPPRAAGNVGMARPPAVIVDDAGRETYGLGNEALGGIWEYWFCATCNNETGLWDEAFAAWTHDPLSVLHDPQSSGSRMSAVIDGDPGAFVRCLWAWMFVISDNRLIQRIPNVAAAVKSGEPVEPPEHPRLFLAVTREVQIGIQALPNRVIVVSPPFVTMLLSARVASEGRGYFDTGPWLRFRAGSRRTCEIDVPIVDLGSLPMLGDPVLDEPR